MAEPAVAADTLTLSYPRDGRGIYSKEWTQLQTTVDDFFKRLKNFHRIRQTRAEFLALPKDTQIRIKNEAGGFFGGALAGSNRRKADVTARTLLTLDYDSCPASAPQTLCEALAGYRACLYSTQKSTPEKPRLRLCIAVNRPMDPDEYGAVVHQIAQDLPGGDWLDPSSLDLIQMMFCPAVFADGEPFYYVSAGAPVDVDAVLDSYINWRNCEEWPLLPGEKPKRKPAPKGDPGAASGGAGYAEDPRKKGGWVGAFCRAYSVTRTLNELLPGTYTPGTGAGRWTYSGSSSANGGICYDDLFFYSHHAKDPVSGQSVNAFDLVRLHRFGERDASAKPGTPMNKLPSYLAMVELCKTMPDVVAEHGKQQAEAVAARIGAGFKKLPDGDGPERASKAGAVLAIAAAAKSPLTLCTMESLLVALKLQVRTNEITGRTEFEGNPFDVSMENAPNLVPVHLLNMCRGAGVPASKDTVFDLVDAIAEKHRFNPVLDMFTRVKWDGHNRVGELYTMLGIFQSDNLSRLLIWKWLQQCCALACNTEGHAVGADGVLVLAGPQGIGKTSFFRELIPLPGMFAEGRRIDPADKDTLLQSLNVWICELGELEQTTKRDAGALKAFLTQSVDEIRAPYGRKATRRPRRTSFCATVNGTSFLQDETGNRRFWTVEVSDIDTARLFGLSTEWKEQIWAQVYAAYRTRPTDFRLTREELAQLEERNRRFEKPLELEAEVLQELDFDLPQSEWKEITLSAMADRIGKGGESRKVGRVLSRLAQGESGITCRTAKGRQRFFRVPLRP